MRPFQVNETGSFADQRSAGQRSRISFRFGPDDLHRRVRVALADEEADVRYAVLALRPRVDLLREPGHLERQVR